MLFEEDIVTTVDLVEAVVILLASGIDLAVALVHLREVRRRRPHCPEVDNDGDQ